MGGVEGKYLVERDFKFGGWEYVESDVREEVQFLAAHISRSRTAFLIGSHRGISSLDEEVSGFW
jgi:hypothetical protein